MYMWIGNNRRKQLPKAHHLRKTSIIHTGTLGKRVKHMSSAIYHILRNIAEGEVRGQGGDEAGIPQTVSEKILHRLHLAWTWISGSASGAQLRKIAGTRLSVEGMAVFFLSILRLEMTLTQ